MNFVDNSYYQEDLIANMDNKPKITSIDLFRFIPEREFYQNIQSNLEHYSIWSLMDDYFQRDEVANWGIDRKWLIAEIDRINAIYGHEHGVFTLLDPSLMRHHRFVYIKAEFETCGGRRLSGYVMNEDAYYVETFLDGSSFGFNNRKQMQNSGEIDAEKLRKALQNPNDPVFPLKYKTRFFGPDGKLIEGYFQLGTV